MKGPFGATATVGLGEDLTFESNTLNITVTPGSAIVGIEAIDNPFSGAGIIPFSSGEPITMSTESNGTSMISGICSFGSSYTPSVKLISPLDVSGFDQQHFFVMPQDGIITSFRAYFSSNINSDFQDNIVTIQVELWSSYSGNIFRPIPGALILLHPLYTGSQPIGTFSEGSAFMYSFVPPGDRIMLVCSINSSYPMEVSLSGFLSAGVEIKSYNKYLLEENANLKNLRWKT